MHINLLPASTRLVIQFDQHLRIYLKGWIVGGLASLIYFTYQLILCQAAQTHLTQLDLACESVRQTQNEIAQQKQSLAAIAHRKLCLAALQTTSRPITILAAVVRAVSTQPGLVHLQRLSIQADPSQAAAAGGPGATTSNSQSSHVVRAGGQSVVIMGQAEDESSLARFIVDLRQSGWLESVELKSSSRSSNSSIRQFHIEARHAVADGTITPVTPQVH